MKLESFAVRSKNRGTCHVCGKSTSLFVHQECGKKLEEKKRSIKVSGVDGGRLNMIHQDNARHNASKKRYASGYVPKFCFD